MSDSSSDSSSSSGSDGSIALFGESIVSTIPESPSTPTLERPDRVSCREYALRCLCLPLVLVGTICLALILVVFGAIPMALFGLLLVTFYYCCTREPIPVRVLLRALFDSDPDPLDGSNGLGSTQWTTEDIESSLTRRLCLGKWAEEEAASVIKTAKDVARYPNHRGKVYWEYEGGHGKMMYYVFSEPLSPAKKVVDDEEADAVPHYRSWHRASGNNNGNASDHSVASSSSDSQSDNPNTNSSNSNANKGDGARSEEDEFDRIEKGEGNSTPKDDHAEDSNENNNGNDAPVSNGEITDENDQTDDVDQSSQGDEARRCCASCDICLLEYDEGDVVAWSTNKKCRHAFHSDCLVDWISRKPTCPSCRQDYRISASK